MNSYLHHAHIPVRPLITSRYILPRRQAPDDLTATEPSGGFSDDHAMAHGAEGFDDGGVDVALDLDLAATGPLPAGGVEALLGVHGVVYRVDDHLHVALGLHVTAHDAEGPDGLALPCEESGDDGVVGALAGLEGVG